MTIAQFILVVSLFSANSVVGFILGAWVFHRGRKGESPIPSIPKKPEPPKEPERYPVVKP